MMLLVEYVLLPCFSLSHRPGAGTDRPPVGRLLFGRAIALPCYGFALFAIGGLDLRLVWPLAILWLAPFLPLIAMRMGGEKAYGIMSLVFMACVLAVPLAGAVLLPPAAMTVLTALVPSIESGLLTPGRTLALCVAYLMMFAPGTAFVRAVLTWLPKKSLSLVLAGVTESAAAGEVLVTDEGLVAAGRILGYLERVIIVTLTIISQYTAIGFILTAKSIARFNFANRGMAEYYLLGTLASSILALLVGTALNQLWPFLK